MLSNNPFKRPFPDREFGRDTVIGMGRVAAFVFAVLYFLRPQGLHIPGNELMTCLGYGLVTFLVGTAYAYISTDVLKWRKSGDSWTLGKWIIDAGLMLAAISIGNFVFYNATVGWTAFHPLVLAAITVPTVLIGLFPIAFSGMAIQLRAERNHQRVAGEVKLASIHPEKPHGSRMVSLADGALTIDPEALLFCEARQNYVRCLYLLEGNAKEATIRTTLSALETDLSPGPVLRCHRSYLVNPHHIRQAHGNAQGLKLELVGTAEEVPVSRSYVEELRGLVR